MASLKYVTTFAVSGSSSFPTDMLRRDRRFPDNPDDADKINEMIPSSVSPVVGSATGCMNPFKPKKGKSRYARQRVLWTRNPPRKSVMNFCPNGRTSISVSRS